MFELFAVSIASFGGFAFGAIALFGGGYYVGYKYGAKEVAAAKADLAKAQGAVNQAKAVVDKAKVVAKDVSEEAKKAV